MKNIKSLIIGALIIIILGMACAVNTEAATGKYVKSISEIVPEGEYILEAVEFPKSSTTKIPGYVATPDSTGWMGLKKYAASTAEYKHQIWHISNRVYDYQMGELTLSTYTITNSDPLPYWSNAFMGRAVTYTSKGFYRQEEIYGEFGTMYEHWNSPAQRFKIVKTGTDKKTGAAILKFPNAKSGKAFASGGYGLFILKRVG
jgi:hypothetical protein